MTMLLSLLGGLDMPKGGEILFEGENVAEMDLKKSPELHIVCVPEL